MTASNPFDDLGPAIERAWQRLNYDERAFPALAAKALRAARLHERTDHAEVIRWTLSTPELPQQDDLEATFGEPPITLYHGRRFFIQVLLWLDGSTSIHRHAFCGAFAVLAGSSLHSRYAFEVRRRISSRFLLGDLRLRGAELLERGDVVEITADLIHGLFHFETPSATVIVRTYLDDEAAPQYSYRPPCLAIDSFYQEPSMVRRLQALRFARTTGPAAYPALAAGLIERTDLHTGWLVLNEAVRGPSDPADLDLLMAAARNRHGAVMESLSEALLEDLRDRKIQRLRDDQTDPELRFFLALLQNLPQRDAILKLIRRRYPKGDPRKRVIGWVDALSGVDAIGIDLRDDLTREMFLALLDGRSQTALLARLKRRFDAKEVEARKKDLADHAERIRRSALAPLFRAPRAGLPARPANR
jgi:hypothetical protein